MRLWDEAELYLGGVRSFIILCVGPYLAFFLYAQAPSWSLPEFWWSETGQIALDGYEPVAGEVRALKPTNSETIDPRFRLAFVAAPGGAFEGELLRHPGSQREYGPDAIIGYAQGYFYRYGLGAEDDETGKVSEGFVTDKLDRGFTDKNFQRPDGRFQSLLFFNIHCGPLEGMGEACLVSYLTGGTAPTLNASFVVEDDVKLICLPPGSNTLSSDGQETFRLADGSSCLGENVAEAYREIVSATCLRTGPVREQGYPVRGLALAIDLAKYLYRSTITSDELRQRIVTLSPQAHELLVSGTPVTGPTRPALRPPPQFRLLPEWLGSGPDDKTAAKPDWVNRCRALQ